MIDTYHSHSLRGLAISCSIGQETKPWLMNAQLAMMVACMKALAKLGAGRRTVGRHASHFKSAHQTDVHKDRIELWGLEDKG